MVLKIPKVEPVKRALPAMRGWPRKFSSFLRFQQYRSDEVSVSSVIVALDGTGDFDDIQAAINYLPTTGGQVIIKNGTFEISVEITITGDNVSLVGSGPSTIIKKTVDTGFFNRAINISGNNCTIKKFEVFHSAKTAANDIAIQVTGDDFWAEEIGVDNASHGIKLVSMDRAFIKSVFLKAGASMGAGNALWINNSNSIVVRDSNLPGNTGVKIEGNLNKIIQNTIHSTPQAGVLITSGSFNIIDGNDISDADDYGIKVSDGADQNIISNNSIQDSSLDVTRLKGSIFIESDSNQILNNAISNTKGGDAINVDGGNQNIISSNKIIAVEGSVGDPLILGDGIDLDSSSSFNIVSYNQISGVISSGEPIDDNGSNNEIGHNITD